jgi:hypothetical protein
VIVCAQCLTTSPATNHLGSTSGFFDPLPPPHPHPHVQGPLSQSRSSSLRWYAESPWAALSPGQSFYSYLVNPALFVLMYSLPIKFSISFARSESTERTTIIEHQSPRSLPPHGRSKTACPIPLERVTHQKDGSGRFQDVR